MIPNDVFVTVPVRSNFPGRRVLGSAVDLDKSHASLRKPTREQTLPAERPDLGMFDVIKLFRDPALAVKIGHFRRAQLQAGRHLVGGDAGFEFTVPAALFPMHPVEVPQESESGFIALRAYLRDLLRRKEI